MNTDRLIVMSRVLNREKMGFRTYLAGRYFRENPGASFTEVAEKLGVSSAQVTTLVDNLMGRNAGQRGAYINEKGQEDRRASTFRMRKDTVIDRIGREVEGA